MTRILVVLGLVAVLLTTGFTSDEVCPGLDSGKIDTSGDPQSVTVTAPAGQLISGYCVKGGSEGPIFVTVDPPASSVTIDYPGVNGGGQQPAVSHYSLSYVTVTTTTPPPTTAPPTTSTTTTTVVPPPPPPPTSTTTTTTTEVPPPTTTPPPTTDTTVPPPPPTNPKPPPPVLTVPTCADSPNQTGCAELARTGNNYDGWVLWALALIMFGTALVLVTKRVPSES